MLSAWRRKRGGKERKEGAFGAPSLRLASGFLPQVKDCLSRKPPSELWCLAVAAGLLAMHLVQKPFIFLKNHQRISSE